MKTSYSWLGVYICEIKINDFHSAVIVSAPHLDEWVCGEGKKVTFIFNFSPPRGLQCSYLPGGALRRYVSEDVLWFRIRDGNDVFVVRSYDLLCVVLRSEVSGAQGLVVWGRREGQGGKRGSTG